MIKMFCLKDQKNPHWLLSLLLLLSFTIVVVFFGDVVICVASPFYPPGVTGEYDLRKGEKKKKKKKSAVERKHGFDITNPPLLYLSLFCVYRETDKH